MAKKKRKKQAKAPPYTQFTLKWLREECNFTDVDVAEKDIRTGRISFKRDLFNFIDVVAITPDGILAVQTTSVGGLRARVKKIREGTEDMPHIPNTAAAWLAAGGKIWAVGWEKGVKRGTNSPYWLPRVVEFVPVTRHTRVYMKQRELSHLPRQEHL